MSALLPSFNELVKMAKEDPDKLDQLQKKLCEELIQNAPQECQRKLRGTQFKVDMERRRARSPLAACMKISNMMQESFSQLREVLNEVQTIKTPHIKCNTKKPIDNQVKEPSEASDNSILRFPPIK